ncbi:unnamed protein product, partial [Ectocarpus sp. 13 AM-2016]
PASFLISLCQSRIIGPQSTASLCSSSLISSSPPYIYVYLLGPTNTRSDNNTNTNNNNQTNNHYVYANDSRGLMFPRTLCRIDPTNTRPYSNNNNRIVNNTKRTDTLVFTDRRDY